LYAKAHPDDIFKYMLTDSVDVHGIMDGEVKTALDHGRCDLIEIEIF
jgi:hypothetical protein